MKTNLNYFIKKWNNRVLQDNGCYLSDEYHSFQIAFINAMRKIAKTFGAEVVNPTYGHYYISGFIKRADKYVYFYYSELWHRTYIQFKPTYNAGRFPPMLVRTAKNEKDYQGGTNNNCYFIECENIIERLLNN